MCRHRVISMSQFGQMGRFGNQVFQYAFLKLYAEEHYCLRELPPWVGNELFGAKDLPIRTRLPLKQEKWKGTHLDEHIPPEGDEFVGTDWRGYAQYHTSYYALHREKIQEMFRLAPDIQESIWPAVGKLRSMGRTVIGIHRRVGDFGRLAFHLTPVDWYRRWLRRNWDRFDQPVLFIATEDRECVREFRRWNPVTTDDLGIKLAPRRSNYTYLPRDNVTQEPWQMDFVPDWAMLTNCDVLLISNSTFGFTAAMMQPRLQELWRSSLPEAGFEKVDPWDARPFRNERVEDYPELEGVRMEKNPYW